MGKGRYQQDKRRGGTHGEQGTGLHEAQSNTFTTLGSIAGTISCPRIWTFLGFWFCFDCCAFDLIV
jgi:hypothetical protein